MFLSGSYSLELDWFAESYSNKMAILLQYDTITAISNQMETQELFLCFEIISLCLSVLKTICCEASNFPVHQISAVQTVGSRDFPRRPSLIYK